MGLKLQDFFPRNTITDSHILTTIYYAAKLEIFRSSSYDFTKLVSGLVIAEFWLTKRCEIVCVYNGFINYQ